MIFLFACFSGLGLDGWSSCSSTSSSPPPLDELMTPTDLPLSPPAGQGVGLQDHPPEAAIPPQRSRKRSLDRSVLETLKGKSHKELNGLLHEAASEVIKGTKAHKRINGISQLLPDSESSKGNKTHRGMNGHDVGKSLDALLTSPINGLALKTRAKLNGTTVAPGIPHPLMSQQSLNEALGAKLSALKAELHSKSNGLSSPVKPINGFLKVPEYKPRKISSIQSPGNAQSDCDKSLLKCANSSIDCESLGVVNNPVICNNVGDLRHSPRHSSINNNSKNIANNNDLTHRKNGLLQPTTNNFPPSKSLDKAGDAMENVSFNSPRIPDLHPSLCDNKSRSSSKSASAGYRSVSRKTVPDCSGVSFKHPVEETNFSKQPLVSTAISIPPSLDAGNSFKQPLDSNIYFKHPADLTRSFRHPAELGKQLPKKQFTAETPRVSRKQSEIAKTAFESSSRSKCNVVRFPVAPKKKEVSEVCQWEQCGLMIGADTSLLEHIQVSFAEQIIY